MTWRIYYADGTVTGGVGQPRDVCCDGVLAILHGGVIEHGFDHYLWREDFGDWIGTKGAAVETQFKRHAGQIKACLEGESVPNEVFQAVMRRVVEDQAHDQSGHRPG